MIGRNPRLWLPDDWDESRLDTSERSYVDPKRNAAIAALRLPAEPTERRRLAAELLELLEEDIADIVLEIIDATSRKKGRNQ